MDFGEITGILTCLYQITGWPLLSFWRLPESSSSNLIGWSILGKKKQAGNQRHLKKKHVLSYFRRRQKMVRNLMMFERKLVLKKFLHSFEAKVVHLAGMPNSVRLELIGIAFTLISSTEWFRVRGEHHKASENIKQATDLGMAVFKSLWAAQCELDAEKSVHLFWQWTINSLSMHFA